MLMLLATGAVVLAASAAAGRYYWPAEGARTAAPAPSLVPADFTPQVWIWSHETNAPEGFADLTRQENPLGMLPGQAPLPRITQRYVASQPRLTSEPQQAEAAGTEPAAPRIADAAPLDEQNTGESGSQRTEPAPARTIVIASRPPLVPPRRALRSGTAGLRADAATEATVEIAIAAPVEAPVAGLAAGLADPGLARSPRPPARPESVVRMASLVAQLPAAQPAAGSAPSSTGPSSTGPSSAAPSATQPTQVAAALDVPPLSAGRDSCPASLTRALPQRPSGAQGGQAAIARLASSAGSGRDTAIAQAVISGNLPDFLRRLVPVTVTGTGADGRPARITLCVMPDYLALGSDSDFVRVPLGLPAASLIAERFDMVLPTTRMVDAIHAQASLRLRPSPMTPGAQMASTDYFLRHNATLEGQRRTAGGTLGMLVSGHKKDLVLSNRLERNPGRVAIYGWHQANGQPIQPLSTVHGASYADYSHGIRLVSRTAFINGQAVDLRDLLGDGRYAGLISSEGPITSRLMLAALR